MLDRDDVLIGFTEDGSTPSHEGCTFEVDDIEAAHAELLWCRLDLEPDFKPQNHGVTTHRLIFIARRTDRVTAWVCRRLSDGHGWLQGQLVRRSGSLDSTNSRISSRTRR